MALTTEELLVLTKNIQNRIIKGHYDTPTYTMTLELCKSILTWFDARDDRPQGPFESPKNELTRMLLQQDISNDQFDAIYALEELCRACSQSRDPKRLIAKIEEIVNIVDNENEGVTL